MNKGDLTRVKIAFDVFSETYSTHAPALINAFNDWMEAVSIKLDVISIKSEENKDE